MFSGKTTNLLQKLIFEASLGRKVLYINSVLDTRSTKPYSTHNPFYKDKLGNIENVTLKSYNMLPPAEDILQYDYIYIDEAQMFEDLNNVLVYVEKYHKSVFVSGLVGYASRESFGKLTTLIPYADKCTQLYSKCHKCLENGNYVKALFTHKRDNNNNNSIDIGGDDKYIAVCRKHYIELNL
jgi:thymidine kinase